MNNTYPYNRLQELQLRRITRPWYIFMMMSIVWAVTVLLTPHTYAYSAAITNPSNAPTFPSLPSSFASNYDCSGTKCGRIMWTQCRWDATHDDTCVFVGDSSQTYGRIENVVSGAYFEGDYTTPEGADQIFAFPNTTDFPYRAHYTSGSWSYSGFANAKTLLSGPFTNGVASNYNVIIGDNNASNGWYRSDTCINQLNSTYGFSSYMAGGRCPNSGEIAINGADFNLNTAVLSLTTTGALLTATPLEFRLAFSGATFDVWTEWFYKNPTRPQYRTNLGQNFNLGRQADFRFSSTYSGSGSYSPKAVIGNIACTGASTISVALTGSGCVYSVIPINRSFFVRDNIFLYNTNSGSTNTFQWVGPTTLNQYYSTYTNGKSYYNPIWSGSDSGAVFTWVAASSGSLYNGQFPETLTGTTPLNLVNGQGIFQTGFFNFNGFGYGDTGNVFLNIGQSFMRVVLQGAVWVAQFVFNKVISVSAFYSFIYTVLHPVAGSVMTVPSTIFGFHNPAFGGTSFTVVYASEGGNAQNVTKLIQIATILSGFMYVGRKFLLIRR